MMKKIYILWLRQIKRWLRSRSRIIGSLAQPLLFLWALGYGFSSVFEKAGQGNYLNFLAPGIIGMGIIFTAIFSGIEVIWDRQFGFLKETLVAPMSRLHIMIGRTLGGATIATAQGIMVMFLAMLFGFRMEHWLSVFPAIGVMFLIALLFTSLGTMIASLLKDMQGFQLIMNFLIMPLFFLSGALFPLEGLPTTLSIIARLDPLSYGIDALREIFLGMGHYGLTVDLIALGSITAIFLWLGSYFFKKIQI
ncbi:multidrug ABC transporter permease [Candidatus Falkowbacteria bacterium RIFOXYB2_FULL_38_15]|uniref:Transport permease protein n=1 Tax=Candidatus Falkowbacteria bacterium RIFOXYA2_FULL_38_12 TaxID=1797993 RepID=A0A1F5S3I6_9BACT|nr:MAG: multidrug ABC transporter permease [Candidatus Falkowbacteria bacterium RIFOXYA2_FULL_38_12]OGF33694.1 MAG: multidrug ABC transporter permease [Candidatus Falkowbacteria bacterium RIFOXYB2_FULL_38_15]OGF42102.1 MAG: multidrug ABC transporter permease [Candidatus Falkowbacteria bacterium RIFOXYD2_FULL_39_16]